jgi:hypothetical protein
MRSKMPVGCCHGLHDGGGDQREIANAVAALNGAIDAVGIGAVVAELADNGQAATPEETPFVEGDILFVDPSESAVKRSVR